MGAWPGHSFGGLVTKQVKAQGVGGGLVGGPLVGGASVGGTRVGVWLGSGVGEAASTVGISAGVEVAGGSGCCG